jgi:hypothetical protein
MRAHRDPQVLGYLDHPHAEVTAVTDPTSNARAHVRWVGSAPAYSAR